MKPAAPAARRLAIDLDPAAAAEAPALRVALSEGALRRCPFCRDELGPARRTCAACRTQVHPECAEEFGACPTSGCAGGRWIAPGGAEEAPLDPQVAPARRRWPWLLALAPLLLLGGLWLGDSRGPEGQERALGGWASGHGSPFSAALGALSKKGYDKDVGNVAVVDVAVQAQGEWIASAAEDGEVILWSARDGAELRELQGSRIAPQEGQVRIAFDGAGQRLFLKCAGTTAWLDPQGGYRQLHGLELGEIAALTPCEGGVRIAHVEAPDLLVSELREEELRTLRSLPLAGQQRVAFAQEGRRLFVADGGRLREFDLEGGGAPRSHPLYVLANELAVSPQGEQVAWIGKKGALVARLGGPPRQLPPDWGAWGFTGLAFSPDGRQLAAGRLSGGVWVWEVETGERIASWDGPVAGQGPGWSADGAFALTWGRDQKVRLYRAR